MGFFVLLIAFIAASARPASALDDVHSVDTNVIIFPQTTEFPGTHRTTHDLVFPDTLTSDVILPAITVAPGKEQTHDIYPSGELSVSSNEIVTNGQSFSWQDIRLPRDILPDLYEVAIHANISQSVFAGNVTMHCTVVKATDLVVFHTKDLAINLVEVRSGEDALLTIKEQGEFKENEQYQIKLEQRLASGSKIKIVVSFGGKLENKLSGFYKSSYKTRTGETRTIASTHFQPSDARAAFPCFDEPDFKANYTMSLIREPHHVALANMPVRRTSDYYGLLRDDFETSVKMSTYLVAFAICDYKNVTATTKQGTVVSVWAPAEQIDQANYALSVAVNVLNYYNDFFGLPYPLPKQDMIAIPDFSGGAMENWGLITYRLTAVLYDPTFTDSSSKEYTAYVVAHELAHQWFGNIVTPKWWNDLWLNEGFATFVGNVGSGHAQPDFKREEQFMLSSFQLALHLDDQGSSHPVQVDVEDPAQIGEIFDTISYRKGASIIRMLQGFLGELNFQRGLASYLKTYAYGNAETSDLWKSLQSAVNLTDGLTVSSVMDTWTLQMGYPVVTVKRKPGSINQVTVTQERFLTGKPSPEQEANFPSPLDYKWNIPFTYMTSTNGRIIKWMKTSDSEVTIDLPTSDSWLKGNVKAMGFYRVNYDDELWQKIIDLLKQNSCVFSPEDRAGLIDDAYSLAKVGQLKYDTLFDLLGYLRFETHYVPWKTAISNYRFILDRMYLTDVYSQLQNYMLDLMSERLTALGWDEPESHLDKLLQSSMLSFAFELGDKNTKEEAKKKFDAWRFNNVSLPKDLKALILKAGVETGDDEVWKFVCEKYSSSMVPTEKKMLLGSLTKTREPRRIQLFLQDSLDGNKIPSQDTPYVMGGVAGTGVGIPFSWRFLQQNWPTYYERYGRQNFLMGRILKSVVERFNTQFDYDEVAEFFRGKDVGTGDMALKQALETVASHIDWSKKYEQVVRSWVQKHLM